MDLTDIIEIPDFLSKEDAQKIWDYHQKPNWKFGHSSNKDADEVRFWQMELSSDEYFSEYLFEKILSRVEGDFRLERVYANGHLFGTSGSPHHDSFKSFDRTALFYANPVWKPEWGGKTAFSLNGVLHYVTPEPNKLIVFPGLIPHWAEDTSRAFTGLRVTVAWKLIHDPKEDS